MNPTSPLKPPRDWWMYEFDGDNIPPENLLHAGDIIHTAFPLEDGDEQPWTLPENCTAAPTWTPTSGTGSPRPWLAPGIQSPPTKRPPKPRTKRPSPRRGQQKPNQERETALLRAVVEHIQTTGTAPTLGELRNALGLQRSSIQHHLRGLARSGHLSLTGGPRGIRVIQQEGVTT